MRLATRKGSTHAVPADGQVGVALDAALRQVGRDRLAARHADDGAAGAVGDDIVGKPFLVTVHR